MSHRLVVAAVPALVALGLFLAPGLAAAADTGQVIYLDPDTGEVMDMPSDAGAAQKAARPDTSSGDDDTRYQSWTTPDGVRMLKASPEAGAAEQVTRCADGSLRMGRPAAGHALCDTPAD